MTNAEVSRNQSQDVQASPVKSGVDQSSNRTKTGEGRQTLASQGAFSSPYEALTATLMARERILASFLRDERNLPNRGGTSRIL